MYFFLSFLQVIPEERGTRWFSEDLRYEKGVSVDSQQGSARERGTRRDETCITHSITELGIEIDYNIMVAMHMRGAGGM